MNCLEFESQLEVLARGALLEARTRSAAEAHEETCAACAARLADERALSGGLRALASGMKGAQAPARVEAALGAAFRANVVRAGRAETAHMRVGGNVVPRAGHAAAGRWSWAKTAAVATLAAAASLALFVLVRPGAPVNAPASSSQMAGSVRSSKMIEPPPGALGGSRDVAQSNASPGSDELVTPAPTPGAFKGRASRSYVSPRPRAVDAAYNTGGGALTQSASAQEIATDFITLTQAGPYTEAEESHLVRVELPRSALASFGLPVNAETAGGRVKADVLVGQDGLARAIRFVR